jgi:hypothetical protein
MNDRVYVLLDVIDGKSTEVVHTLIGKGGVVSADMLEDPSSVVLVVEADDRKQLAALTIQAIASVDNMTHGLRLLPVKNNEILAPIGINIGSSARRHVFSGKKGVTT